MPAEVPNIDVLCCSESVRGLWKIPLFQVPAEVPNIDVLCCSESVRGLWKIPLFQVPAEVPNIELCCSESVRGLWKPPSAAEVSQQPVTLSTMQTARLRLGHAQ